MPDFRLPRPSGRPVTIHFEASDRISLVQADQTSDDRHTDVKQACTNVAQRNVEQSQYVSLANLTALHLDLLSR